MQFYKLIRSTNFVGTHSRAPIIQQGTIHRAPTKTGAVVIRI